MNSPMSKLLLIIACVTTIISGQSLTSVGGITIDEALQRSMLDIHNSLRSEVARYGLADEGLISGWDTSQPQATYMNELHYDPALAALAQNYLNQQTVCSISESAGGFGHNDNRGSEFLSIYGQYASFQYDSSASSIGIGENILEYPRDTSLTSYEQAATAAEDGWWNNEYPYYLYSHNYCFPSAPFSCGHYTQIAWADTRYIGCGSIECNKDNGASYLISLCNYYPAGNVGTNKPYTEGTPCSECATKASDRDQCNYPSSTSGLCSGCQSEFFGVCSDVASNCASDLAHACPVECETINELYDDSEYDGILNGHLCTACTETCGTCTASMLAATECVNDGLAYQFSGFSAFTSDDDPTVITQTANWAIAGMCMIFGVCCIILGIGYYLHSKKVDQLKIKLKATKLIDNDVSKKEDNLRARAMSETIDGGATNTIDVNVEVDEYGETIEIETSIEKTNE